MSSLGDRLAAVRAEKNLTRQAVADRMARYGVRIHETTLQKLEERGSTKSKYSREIALAIEVNHDWLVSGKGPKETNRSLDAKLQLLPQDEIDEVYDDLAAIIDRRLDRARTTR